MPIAAIIVAAGSGSRAGEGIPKQYRAIGGKPMLRHSVEAFAAHPATHRLILVIAPDQHARARDALSGIDTIRFVVGGAERRESVLNALEELAKSHFSGAVFIHDAARPFLNHDVIDRLCVALEGYDGAVPALPVVDSLARADAAGMLTATVERDALYRVQTPQAFHFQPVLDAHRRWDPGQPATDDARIAMAAGFRVAMVEGDERLAKYTFADDFARPIGQAGRMMDVRTGTGFDVHRLAAGEELWLCGVKIEHAFGLAGHSDADVALHALTDAVLGAAALGDIGDHFPPSEERWRGASSDRFLRHALELARERGFEVNHLDVTLICEAPKIAPHKAAMRARVADIARIDPDRVSIKATTTEKLGFAGRAEGIAAQAAATLAR